jgi:DNA processing protein
MNDKLYWLALNMIPGVGPVSFRKLLARFHDPERIFAASVHELASVEGIAQKTVQAIKEFSASKMSAEELTKVSDLGADIVTLRDARYPKNLLEIYDPPPVLYVRGGLDAADTLQIAVVGSRRGSSYGRAVTKRISRELGEAGVTVVSGLARGIDTCAHLGALEARAKTIAVLGCGVDTVYPPENKKLFFDIIKSGAIISEFPLGTSPDGKNFPRRNRIISGLSLGVVVVEATADSGSLITATHALEQGREVFAVPGNVGMATSRGTNRLIKQGARLIEEAQDILTEVLPQYSGAAEKESLPPLTSAEGGVLQHLSHTPLHIDEICRLARMEIQRVSTILLELELKGVISQMSGKLFIRN